MKIGIMTFHRAANYGALFQAYALQKTIRKLGCDAQIIDYDCETIRRSSSASQMVGNKVKALIKLPLQYSIRKKKLAAFEQFIDKHLKLSAPYSTMRQLVHAQKDYDRLITGSDQVWNTDCAGFDPAYFLSFVPDGIKKNAYAASFGFSDLPSSYTDEYKRRLDGFHCISVREASGAKIIKSLLGYDVPVVLDPTLLLDSEDWQSITPALPKRKKGYILVYNVLKPVQMLDYARRLAREKGLEILYINDETYQNFDLKHVRALSPEGFLALYKNADYVLTNSFHGTVFSIIFKRPFLSEIEVYKNGTIGKNGRAQDLLQALGLQQRTLAQGCKIDDVIDWRTADQKKAVLRDASLRCLQEIWREENG